jgi:hypothetical protein
MVQRDDDCPFCNIRAPILESELAFLIFDKYPVKPGPRKPRRRLYLAWAPGVSWRLATAATTV